MQTKAHQEWTTRIAIDDIILTGNPGVEIEDIRACLAYASAALHAEKVYPLATRLTDAPIGE